jgi:hypothetical protein
MEVSLMTMTQHDRRSALPEPQRPVPRTKRRLADRLTLNVVAGLVAALLAFVLVASILRDRRSMITVAVANDRIPAGVTITPAMVRAVAMPANVGFADGLLRFDRIGATPVVAARTVQPGEAIPTSAIGEPGKRGARVMSISVESWQAAGGEIQVGDQVDVIDTGKTGPRYVLTGAPVVGRAENNAGGLAGASRQGGLYITVEVSESQGLVLAEVIEAGKFVLVRSTGVAT